MFYYKNGSTYISSSVVIENASEITKSEYDEIKSIISNQPAIPDGYGCRLTSDLQWELYELPIDQEATAQEYEEAGKILMGVSE